MGKYRKLIAAAIGILAMLLGPSFLGLGDGETIFGIAQDAALQAVIGALTAFGVFQAANDPE